MKSIQTAGYNGVRTVLYFWNFLTPLCTQVLRSFWSNFHAFVYVTLCICCVITGTPERIFARQNLNLIKSKASKMATRHIVSNFMDVEVQARPVWPVPPSLLISSQITADTRHSTNVTYCDFGTIIIVKDTESHLC